MQQRAAHRGPVWRPAAALRALGEEPHYLPDEQAFQLSRTEGALTTRLHLTFREGQLELGVYVKTPQGELGGTAHSLAMQVARRQNPELKRAPAYPKIPYVTAEDHRAVLKEVVKLFTDVHRALVKSGGAWA